MEWTLHTIAYMHYSLKCITHVRASTSMFNDFRTIPNERDIWYSMCDIERVFTKYHMQSALCNFNYQSVPKRIFQQLASLKWIISIANFQTFVWVNITCLFHSRGFKKKKLCSLPIAYGRCLYEADNLLKSSTSGLLKSLKRKSSLYHYGNKSLDGRQGFEIWERS